MIAGYALTGLALVAMLVFEPDTGLGTIAVGLVALGVGMGFGIGPTMAAAMAGVPRQRSGIASATVNATRQTGTTLGIAVLGVIMTSQASLTAGLHAAVLVAGIVTLVTTVLLVVALPAARDQERGGADRGLALRTE